MDFEFYNPVRIVFGAGAVSRAGTEASKLGSKAMLVSYAEHDPLADTLGDVRSMMEEAGMTVLPFYEVEPNPDVATVGRGVELGRSEDVELVVAVGGGSAMDAAKAIAAGVYYEGDLWDMVYSRHDGAMKTVPPEKALPTLMIPTLPATGSEMNMCSVISNAALKEKSYIWAECLFPRMAIIDPELTTGLPARQTACAAADTISHVLEIYINGKGDAAGGSGFARAALTGAGVQHYFQEGVMRTVIENVHKALENPNDVEARGHLQWAATCAINGWASPGDAWTPMHQVGHVLTSRHGVDHGSSLSVVMPAWMDSFKDRRPGQYLRFARRVMDVDGEGKTDGQIIDEGVAGFRDFLRGIGAPVSLSEVGIEEGDLAEILGGVVRVSFGADGKLDCNPPVSREDLMGVLRRAL